MLRRSSGASSSSMECLAGLKSSRCPPSATTSAARHCPRPGSTCAARPGWTAPSPREGPTRKVRAGCCNNMFDVLFALHARGGLHHRPGRALSGCRMHAAVCIVLCRSIPVFFPVVFPVVISNYSPCCGGRALRKGHIRMRALRTRGIMAGCCSFSTLDVHARAAWRATNLSCQVRLAP